MNTVQHTPFTLKPTVPRVRTSVVCVHDNRVLCIELEDPTTKKRMWSLPGGQVEASEDIADCAVRETLEETGYSVLLVSEALTTEYRFRWDAKVYACTCHWFRATLNDEAAVGVDDAAYLLGSRWLPVQQVPTLLGYHPHIQTTTQALLDRF